MSIALALTIAALSNIQPSCSWDQPGVNPYTGNAAAAIDRYADLSPATRAELKRRVAAKQPDDMVSISRDAITSSGSKGEYDPVIRDMHFGAASMCRTVTRNKWSKSRREDGAVYCVDDQCVLVPKICGNFSRISRRGGTPVAHEAAEGVGGRAPIQIAAAAPVALLPEVVAPLAVRSAPPEQGFAPVPYGPPPGFVNTSPPFEVHNGVPLPPQTPPVPPVAPPVPEADTWAMLLAGLGFVGFYVRRARKAA